jgi:hypothetical protein
MSDDPTRAPFSQLRAMEPESDEAARAQARDRLYAHIARTGLEPRTPGRRSVSLRRLRRLPGRWLTVAALALTVAGAGGAVAAVLLQTAHTDRLPVFTAQGQLSAQFHVGATGRGYCWTASLAADTSDAYRCMQGNAIHDPCFAASTHATTVACFLDPWHSVTVLRLTRRLPSHGRRPSGPVLPWAIVTSTGLHCVFLTGATAPMGGERINYGCTDGSYLLGNPNTSQPLWTIRRARRYVPDEPGHPQKITSFPLIAIKQTIS